jgi:hypothetical protein
MKYLGQLIAAPPGLGGFLVIEGLEGDRYGGGLRFGTAQQSR